ncbi:mobile mystery protein B [Mucilaginibacter dorajii]|uniref:Mobile mystery protein B n=1 Tax=Mucilaginibacter dorajii TaxID=692994 RepID=A0ABP7R9F1_9SPHI|nr:mobile mystery protein B [Mucilaginibacter dorajii]MCS3736788.1 Fic-DOC domain mobile mystery protein B [Mucilaginibacter dorajii]
MGVNFEYQDGQTPLDEEEKEGLLITTITTRAELDEFEQLNIQKAIEWTLTRKFNPGRILTEKFVKELHRRMFGDTWAWAGKFRNTNKNIGVDRFHVSIELRTLLDDTQFWIKNAIYPPNEIAIRFKHRIVKIHCFANGNGRHSRLIADILIEHIFNEPVYSWGSSNLIKADEAREQYLRAIRKADNGDIGLLMLFARS